MCGIAGFCDLTRGSRGEAWSAIARRMGETLAHRGPDDDGVWLGKHCALAHRRLAVIDPERGHQPMTVSLEGGTCALCYNGELYNTDVLRQSLIAEGVQFATHTDTEVLLWLLIRHGAAAVERLEGIFAFAFWDGRGEQLLLVRDRCGVKPLFYARVGETLVFGSEPKALFAYPGLEPRADEETWREVLGISPARTPGHGVFAGVEELKPGHLMALGRGGVTVRRWWRVESRPHGETYEDTVAHLRELVSGAIRRQLVSDVPLATLLSGGLDSSVITAVAARASAEEGRPPLETYSFDYTDNDKYFTASSFQPDADWPWVERMREEFGTRHRVLTCPIPALVELLPEAAQAKDMPGMGDMDSSLLWFCREIKRRHTVVLSGECSDEIFGGYPWFHRSDMLAADTFPWSMDMAARTQVLRPEVAERLDLEGYARARYRASVAETPRLEGEAPEERRRREIAWLNLNWFMTNLLDRKDRCSMFAGLEVRVPFCDHALVEYVWNIPWSMKSKDGARKQVLRDAAKGLLPEDVRNRPKSPYPKTHNPLFERLAAARLTAILDDKNAPIHALVDEDALRRGLLVSAGDYGRPWFGQLMAGPQMIAWLIQLNSWMERFGLVFG
ncbi:MAG: asparagine synthase (glutamine-hydrolyzing) [Oscillospiraceae bacterium]|nr:asparagine synthase (glutamine-hydrolyzing) [Oscillospiraceae bacterium]